MNPDRLHTSQGGQMPSVPDVGSSCLGPGLNSSRSSATSEGSLDRPATEPGEGLSTERGCLEQSRALWLHPLKRAPPCSHHTSEPHVPLQGGSQPSSTALWNLSCQAQTGSFSGHGLALHNQPEKQCPPLSRSSITAPKTAQPNQEAQEPTPYTPPGRP